MKMHKKFSDELMVDIVVVFHLVDLFLKKRTKFVVGRATWVLSFVDEVAPPSSAVFFPSFLNLEHQWTNWTQPSM